MPNPKVVSLHRNSLKISLIEWIASNILTIHIQLNNTIQPAYHYGQRQLILNTPFMFPNVAINNESRRIITVLIELTLPIS